MSRSHERIEIQGPAVPQVTDMHRTYAVHQIITQFDATPDAINIQLIGFLVGSLRKDGSVDFDSFHPILKRVVDWRAEIIAMTPTPPARQREMPK